MITPPATTVRPNTSYRAALILIYVFFALFSSMFAFLLYQGYGDTFRRGGEKVSASTVVVATNGRWMVEVAQQALRRMDSALEDFSKADEPAAVTDLRRSITSLPGDAKAYVVATDGSILFSTDPGVQPIDIRDRPYFAALAAGETFYTSTVMTSRLDGSQIFAFSRRLERDGEFVGAAVLSFSADLMAGIWRSVSLGPGSTVSLVRQDGMVVARYPSPGDASLDISESPLFTEYLGQGNSGTYVSTSQLDQTERIVAYSKIAGTDLIAISAVSVAETFASYWRGIIIVLLLVVPVEVGLAVAAVFIIRLLQRDVRRQEQIARALEANTLLFREIHHRVKNNLQAMQSLVRIQDIPAEAKTSLQSRFLAMASVHEHMYENDAYEHLSATEFLPSVLRPVLTTHGSKAHITFDLDPITINHERASPLALLVNEVVTNVLKYALKGVENGEIKVSLKADGDEQVLTVTDNGKGFDAASATPGMGTRLIKGVVMQMDGTYEYTDDGRTFLARLKLP